MGMHQTCAKRRDVMVVGKNPLPTHFVLSCIYAVVLSDPNRKTYIALNENMFLNPLNLKKRERFSGFDDIFHYLCIEIKTPIV